MTEIFNKQSEKSKRKHLRSHMPNAEIILWGKLCRKQIAGAKFRRQYSIDRFVIDFYCPGLRLAIEVDGPTHQGPEAQSYDQVRQQLIESLGIEFLRFTNNEIYQTLDIVLDVIHQKVLSLQSVVSVGVEDPL
ncbi:MAG: endonuclease domain-containing protein [Cyanobacteria bacterium P01_D01_bin.156]